MVIEMDYSQMSTSVNSLFSVGFIPSLLGQFAWISLSQVPTLFEYPNYISLIWTTELIQKVADKM